MKIRNIYGYETCIHSMKRKQAPRRVTSGCDNKNRIFTGLRYEIPAPSMCMTCRFYEKEK